MHHYHKQQKSLYATELSGFCMEMTKILQENKTLWSRKNDY